MHIRKSSNALNICEVISLKQQITTNLCAILMSSQTQFKTTPQKLETSPTPKQYFAALLPSLRLRRVHSRSTKHQVAQKTKPESHKALEHYDCKAPTVCLPSTSKMLLNTGLSAQRAL